MSKKQLVTEESSDESTMKPFEPKLQYTRLCALLDEIGLGYEVTPGKIALINGKHDKIQGRLDAVVTFEYDDAGTIFRMTVG